MRPVVDQYPWHGAGFYTMFARPYDGCDLSIAKDQRITIRLWPDLGRTLRLHDECFHIWDEERQLTISEAARIQWADGNGSREG